jgi:hypothetical protein
MSTSAQPELSPPVTGDKASDNPGDCHLSPPPIGGDSDKPGAKTPPRSYLPVLFPKQPIIRRGQRKPYFKGTRRQVEDRVQAAALLVFCGLSKCEIHAVFRERFGVAWRQTDRYLARARTRDGLTAWDLPG